LAFTGCPIVQTCGPGTQFSVIPQGGVDFGDTSGSSTGLNVGIRGLPTSGVFGPDLGVLYRSADMGSEFGAWAGIYTPFTRSGPVQLGGLAGLEYRRFSYDYRPDEYQIPTGEFGGGAAAFQSTGAEAQNALAVRLGVAATMVRPGSRWSPNAQLTYNAYVAGADFENHPTLAVGVGYQVGGGS